MQNSQRTAADAVRETVRRRGPCSGEAVVASAPARLEVLGGLAAQAGGAVAQMALPERVVAAVDRRTGHGVRIYKAEPAGTAEDWCAEIRDMRGNPAVRYPDRGATGSAPVVPAENWVHAVARLCCRLPATTPLLTERLFGGSPSDKLTGVDIYVLSAVPGRSDKAATVAAAAAVMEALCHASRLPMETMEKALLVQQAAAPDRPSAAVVDALTMLLARDGPPAQLLRYSTQPHALVGQIALPDDVRIVALDTGLPLPAALETLGHFRSAGAMGLQIVETIYRDLGQSHSPLHGYLGNLSPQLYRRYFRALLPRKLRGADFLRDSSERAGAVTGIDPQRVYRVRTAIDHLIAEHEHAENFLQAMEELADPKQPLSPLELQRTKQRAGRLLLASQHSYRLRLEISWREADWLIDTLMTAGPRQGVYGARICGSGGGTVVALMDNSSRANDVLLDVMGTYRKITGLQLGVAVGGARESGAVRVET